MLKYKIVIAVILAILISFTGFAAKNLAQINTAEIDLLNLELNKAQFKRSSVDKLLISSYGMDFNEGDIAVLNVKAYGYKYKDLIIDEIGIQLKDIVFVPEELLSNQALILKQPISSQGYALVTENGINSILNQPKVLSKLSNLTKAKIKKFGIELNSGLISFYKPQAMILPENRIEIQMMASLSNLVSFPVKYLATVELIDSSIVLTNPKLVTSGVTLPDEVTNILNDKLNSLLDFDEKLKEDVDIDITNIQVIPRQQIVINGNATVRKLKFNKKDDE